MNKSVWSDSGVGDRKWEMQQRSTTGSKLELRVWRLLKPSIFSFFFVCAFFIQLHGQESKSKIFPVTRWSTVTKPARRCTGSLTRKSVRVCRSRERSRRQKQPNWGCSRAKVHHPSWGVNMSLNKNHNTVIPHHINIQRMLLYDIDL